MRNNRFFRKLDIILIFAVFLLAFLLYFPKLIDKGELLAHISIDNKEYRVIDLMKLDEDFELSLPSEPQLVLRGGHGYIYVSDALCPDGLCVATGRLTKGGDMAVCIPAQVLVRLVTSEEEKTYDAIAY